MMRAAAVLVLAMGCSSAPSLAPMAPAIELLAPMPPGAVPRPIAIDAHRAVTTGYVAIVERSAIWTVDASTGRVHRIVIDDDPSGLQRVSAYAAAGTLYVVDQRFGAAQRIVSIDPRDGRVRATVDTSDDPVDVLDAATAFGEDLATVHRRSHDVVIHDADLIERWRWGIGKTSATLAAAPGVLLVRWSDGGPGVQAFGLARTPVSYEDATIEGTVTLPCTGEPAATDVLVDTVVVRSGRDGRFTARIRARGTISVAAPAAGDPYGTQIELVGAGRYRVSITAFDDTGCVEPDERG